MDIEQSEARLWICKEMISIQNLNTLKKAREKQNKKYENYRDQSGRVFERNFCNIQKSCFSENNTFGFDNKTEPGRINIRSGNGELIRMETNDGK